MRKGERVDDPQLLLRATYLVRPEESILFSNPIPYTPAPRALLHPRNLHHRPFIMLPSIKRPKPQAESHRGPEDDHAIIHPHRIRFHHRRPHREEPHQHAVQYRQHGHDRADSGTHAEGAPWDLGIRRGEPFVQHDAGGEQEGGVIPRHDEGDERVEPDGGSDVYEGEEQVDEGRYGDGC